jgi:hypothetical protein
MVMLRVHLQDDAPLQLQAAPNGLACTALAAVIEPAVSVEERVEEAPSQRL